MNNRIIKFRIWSKEHNKMFFSDSCPLSRHWISADGRELASCMDYIAIETFGMLCVSYRLKLEEYGNVTQFTGLKDQNGREIYEGDIVKSPNFDNSMVVEYREIMPSDDMTAPGIGFQFNTYPEQMEIIGNIFENPELLNKSTTLA